MEHMALPDALWGLVSLNPCFNGIQMELVWGLLYPCAHSLNPCFNGIQMEPMLKSIRFEWFEGLKVQKKDSIASMESILEPTTS